MSWLAWLAIGLGVLVLILLGIVIYFLWCLSGMFRM